jgi:putative MFS transporter
MTTIDPRAPHVLSDRKRLWAFWLGCVVVTAGVLLHVPMYLMGANIGYQLAGMPMDLGMTIGMLIIPLGCALAGWGLLPRRGHAPNKAHGHDHHTVEVTPPEDAPLSMAHWGLMVTLVVALIIDIMKPASLGFVVPGMIKEYGVSKAMVAWLPFAALTGTVTGSIIWGILADIFGRRASILLSAVMFVGTSICGAMPSFGWNVGMCFLMGAAAGGLLPVAYALLAEIMPTRHRGWSLVLVGGIGAVGGYFAASACSAWLQPEWGWRVMWFLNLPTGLALIALSGAIPESAKFLMTIGRIDAAQAIMKRFGSVVRERDETPTEAADHHHHVLTAPPVERRYAGMTTALSIGAVAWGLVNFGLLLWLPAELVAKGYSMGVSSQLLAKSALIAFPTVFVCAFLYSRWSTKWSLVGTIVVSAIGVAGVLTIQDGASPILPVAMAEASIARADAQGLFQVEDEDLAVADLAGVGGARQGLADGSQIGRHGDLQLDLRQQLHLVFGPAIDLGLALLPAIAAHLGDGQARGAGVGDRFKHRVEAARLDDGDDHLHGGFPISARTGRIRRASAYVQIAIRRMNPFRRKGARFRRLPSARRTRLQHRARTPGPGRAEPRGLTAKVCLTASIRITPAKRRPQAGADLFEALGGPAAMAPTGGT